MTSSNQNEAVNPTATVSGSGDSEDGFYEVEGGELSQRGAQAVLRSRRAHTTLQNSGQMTP